MPLQGIARVLVNEQIMSEHDAISHQQAAKTEHTGFIGYLVSNEIVQSSIIAHTLATNFGNPLFDLDAAVAEEFPINLVSEKLIKRHRLLPLFHRGSNLYLATDDPSNQAAFKEIQFHTGLHPHPIIVEHHKLMQNIDNLLDERDSEALDTFLDDGTDLDFLEIDSGEEEPEELDSSASDDAPVVKFVNKILFDAIKRGASDIHFEPFEKEYRIRCRQDGILTNVASPPIALANKITARIKVMSNLDISERRVPQDGRFKMRLSRAKAIDFRVSTCPTVGGEKVVMRIMDPASTKLGVEHLGFADVQKAHFLSAVKKPQGMILVTGPTGSGKSVTLYTALNLLNTPEVNISTSEDPVEIKVAGINQVNMNPKAGLTFASVLRSFLRQDPDIIMVGEIRDLETAEIAIKAAQTGHMVLSTLHTNSAAETLTRLANMGVPAYNIAGSVSLIIAQRLARRLCENCREVRDDLTEESIDELGFSEEEKKGLKIYKAVGCNQCTKGYKGRIGLFEVLPISKEIGQIIMQGGTSLDILKQAEKEGMYTIYKSGLYQVKNGVTTLEEVSRVTVD